jgi:hypothetical protein
MHLGIGAIALKLAFGFIIFFFITALRSLSKRVT